MTPKQVSIIIATFNSTWERVRASLNSAMMQRGGDFEIVVTDDGSVDNHFEKIEALFQKYSFKDYCLIQHEKNQGTVLNFMDAVEQSRGEYIRFIGQGDMLFDEYTVRDSYENAVTLDVDVALSKAVCYQKVPESIKIFSSPWTVQKERLEMLGSRDYVLYRYPVHGAATFYKRDTLLVYLKKLAGRVKYAEDIVIRLMAFDDRKISFMARNTVYYEIGLGISTSGNWAFSAMQTDEKAFFELFGEWLSHCPDSPQIEKLRLLWSVEGWGERIPFLDRETIVSLLYKKSPEEFKRLCNRLYAIRKKYSRKMSFGDRICCGMELLTHPDIFFRILKGKLHQRMNRAMTDTNVSTAFAELCMTLE